MSETGKDKLFDVANTIFLIMLTALVLYPLIYVISASISNPIYVNSGQMWLLPMDITFEGYTRVMQNQEIWTGYRNTIFYTLAGTMINLAVTLPAAYALARRGLKGKGWIMGLFLFTMFFQGGMIPNYLLVKDLGILNTIWALLLPNAAAVWNIIITRTFFQYTIPQALEESAEIDGCSHTRTFISIVIPLSAPIIAVMALFYGVGHWNQYFSAMIYLSDREMYPLQLILREILVMNQMSAMMTDGESMEAMVEQARIADIIKYAVMIVSALPLMIVYPFVQKYFVKGVMIGSIKG